MWQNFFGWVIKEQDSVQLFSFHHYLYVGLGVLAVFVTLQFSAKIYASPHEEAIRNSVFIFLLGLEVVYHLHNWIHGVFSLPLHISSFAVIMSLALLKTNSQKVFEYVFFFGVLGGSVALLVPFSYGFPYYNIRYHLFLWLHILIVVVPLYYYKGHGYRVSLRSTYKTFFMVLLTIPIIFNLNRFFIAMGLSSPESPINYWFVTEIPKNVTFVFGDRHLIYLGVFVSVIYVMQMFLYKLTKQSDAAGYADE